MASARPKPASVDDYIGAFAPDVRAILQRIRAAVGVAAPDAVEIISYGMPALRQHGVLVYYAAFKGHIGLYPPIRGDAALEREAAPFAGEKGNLRFPYADGFPYELIAGLTALRARQDGERHPRAHRRRSGTA